MVMVALAIVKTEPCAVRNNKHQCSGSGIGSRGTSRDHFTNLKPKP